MQSPILLPHPRTLTPRVGACTLAAGCRIVIQGTPPAALLGAARRLQAAVAAHAGLAWEIAATPDGPIDAIGAVLRVVAASLIEPQGYRLTLGDDGIMLTASDPAGIFYGVCTLAQLLAQYGAALPALLIDDHPDFAARGVMLDISRDKVPTMATLYALIDRLAGWKYNQLQLYTEHTFAYYNHPEVWAAASPMTGEELLLLDAYCRERFVELVPNQNSFGHMTRWLTHERYAPLAETHEEFDTPWGFRMRGPYSLAPDDPGSLALVTSMYDALLPHFSSPLFNVGCDETIDLGQGRSREACEARGTGRVYLEFLLKIYAEVRRRGKTMQFWGDIINHYPELIAELPRDVIALEWGYEADHPFAENCPRYAAAGVPFYVCPGTSAWNSIAGRTDNVLGNLRGAAQHGLASGAIGYLVTDWGDNGHWQQLPVSYLGFAAGAAYAWAFAVNRDREIAPALGRYGFDDPTGSMGEVAYELGNVYRHVGLEPGNSSALFWALQNPPGEREELATLDFGAALEAVDEALAPLGASAMAGPDAALVMAEIELTARMLRHACRRGELMQQGEAPAARRQLLAEDLASIVAEFERSWLARNRPGGLPDSLARFAAASDLYVTPG